MTSALISEFGRNPAGWPGRSACLRLLLIVFLTFTPGCEKPGGKFLFIVPVGYAGKLTIKESGDGVDAFAQSKLRFDATGNLLVKDMDFLNRWNQIDFSFEDGGVIHGEAVVAKVRGAYYISGGTMNQDRGVTYTLRRHE
jgi:hypothetical protein